MKQTLEYKLGAIAFEELYPYPALLPELLRDAHLSENYGGFLSKWAYGWGRDDKESNYIAEYLIDEYEAVYG